MTDCQAEPPKYRKKIIDRQPNKLFTSWIKKLKSEARENRDKTFFTYKKALKSLEKFPLTLHSGHDCLFLEGFGNKTCELVDKKLNELAASQGLTVRKALKKANRELSVSKKSNRGKHTFQLNDKIADLFVCLYKLDVLHVNNVSGFTKFDVLPLAGDNRSRDEKEEIWKCIKSLTKEGYTIQNGRRYKLSDSGKTFYDSEVAHYKSQNDTQEKVVDIFSNESVDETDCMIVEASAQPGSDQAKSYIVIDETTLQCATESVVCYEKVDCIGVEEFSQPSTELTHRVPINDEHKLNFFYCRSLQVTTGSNNFVYRKIHAVFKMIDGAKYYKIWINSDDLSSSITYEYDFESLFNDKGFVYVFLADKDAPSCGNFVEDNRCNKPEQSTVIVSQATIVGPAAKVAKNCTAAAVPSSQLTIQSSISLWPLNLKAKRSQPRICSSDKDNESPAEPLYEMTRDSFDIILIVDNRESYGPGKMKQIICSSLAKKGVRLETRAIAVGDFIWIARDRSGKEAVLDIIIERKRFDDLAKSITDGRYKEQKLRMKQSGFSKIIYLLEKHRGMNNLSLPIETLYQAVINAQVHEGISLVETESGPETINYIALLTKKLCLDFKTKSLRVYEDRFPSLTSNNLLPLDHLFSSSESSVKAVDFASFNSSSQKTRPIPVCEMFYRHLCCINGITAEKAKLVTDHFPTPRLLMETYEHCSTEKSKVELLSNLKLLSSRQFGVVASKAVMVAYTKM